MTSRGFSKGTVSVMIFLDCPLLAYLNTFNIDGIFSEKGLERFKANSHFNNCGVVHCLSFRTWRVQENLKKHNSQRINEASSKYSSKFTSKNVFKQLSLLDCLLSCHLIILPIRFATGSKCSQRLNVPLPHSTTIPLEQRCK